MARILFGNANRSDGGIISNMTVDQVKRAKIIDEH
jgi:hypothetical protein